jgi:hypothetical protein
LETRGQAIVQQAFALLSSNLTKALAAGGVTNALSYCSERALPLTREVASTNEVTIRRATHMARNPANRASPAELAILRDFRVALENQQKPRPVLRTNVNGSVTFYAPILLNNSICLKCHGEPGKDISAVDAAFIRSIYPQDKATGFKLGELRGLWRIDFGAQTKQATTDNARP